MICEKCGVDTAENVELFGCYPARLCLVCRRRIQSEILGNENFVEFSLLRSQLRHCVEKYGLYSDEVRDVQMKIYKIQRDLFPLVDKLTKSDKLIAERTAEGKIVKLRKESDEEHTE